MPGTADATEPVKLPPPGWFEVDEYWHWWTGARWAPYEGTHVVASPSTPPGGSNGNAKRAAEVRVVIHQKSTCPHCVAEGAVTMRTGKAKRGISGGKATAGLLTAGVSLLVVGLSRKQTITQATCSSCHATWTV